MPSSCRELSSLALLLLATVPLLGSSQPSPLPSSAPSMLPASLPTLGPMAPAEQPTSQPTPHPTNRPIPTPTLQPTWARDGPAPSTHPAAGGIPSAAPSSAPSAAPSEWPSAAPSARPSHKPSTHPSPHPTAHPSPRPTAHPTVATAPHAPTNAPVPEPTKSCPWREDDVGDGYCDVEFNTPACDWDGGDCCVGTCQPNLTYDCGAQHAYACLDPSQANLPSATPSLAPTHAPSMLLGSSDDDLGSLSAAFAFIVVLGGFAVLFFVWNACKGNNTSEGVNFSSSSGSGSSKGFGSSRNIYSSSSSSSSSSKGWGLPSLPSFGSGGRTFGGKAKRPLDWEARAVELARFERMSQSSGSAYAAYKPVGVSTPRGSSQGRGKSDQTMNPFLMDSGL